MQENLHRVDIGVTALALRQNGTGAWRGTGPRPTVKGGAVVGRRGLKPRLQESEPIG